MPALALAAFATGACSLVLGLDPLPLRTDAGAPDASGDACDPSLGCSTCPHDFCDDFDLDGQSPSTKWPGILGLESPFLRADASVNLVEGRSAPLALGSHSGGDASVPSHAFVVRPMKGPDGGGPLLYGFDVLIDRITFDDTRGPVPDSGAASVAAVLSPVNGNPAGVAIVVASDGLYLAASEDVLGSTNAGVVRFFKGSIAPLAGNWVRVEVFIGTEQAALALGYTNCKGMKGTLAAARIPAIATNGCTELPAPLADGTWTQLPVLLAGSYMFGAGKLDVRIDNVTADFVR